MPQHGHALLLIQMRSSALTAFLSYIGSSLTTPPQGAQESAGSAPPVSTYTYVPVPLTWSIPSLPSPNNTWAATSAASHKRTRETGGSSRASDANFGQTTYNSRSSAGSSAPIQVSKGACLKPFASPRSPRSNVNSPRQKAASPHLQYVSPWSNPDSPHQLERLSLVERQAALISEHAKVSGAV